MSSCRDCHRFVKEQRICNAVGEYVSPVRACVMALLDKECVNVKGKVLEIGCGDWDYAKKLLESNGCEWFGIDPLFGSPGDKNI